ncbi:MAG: FAD:protein FMN transferase [Lysobacterales bacterium]|nr:MAG: FAD:protein FMN transferase [Xanthomonadales bacterium]
MEAEARTSLLATLLACALGLCVSGCGGDRLLSARWHLFGSEAVVQIVPEGEESRARRALSELAALWNAFHRDWHPWEDGALTRLNHALASGGWSDPLPPSLLLLVDQARRIERLTGARVAPALGELFARFRAEGEALAADPRADSELAALLSDPPRMVHLQRSGDRLRSLHPRLRLDPSAIAEGLALAEGARLLRRHGIRHGLLVLGGEAVALGRHPEGRPWRVALRDPEGGILGLLDLHDREGLFAAGTYARYREDGGKRRSHVFDPRSGRALSALATAAVLHEDPVLADGAATALLIGGAEEFPHLVRELDLGCALYFESGLGLWITTALNARLDRPKGIEAVTLYDAGRDCRRDTP